MATTKTYRKPFTIVHAVTSDQASSGVVRLTLSSMPSGTGLAYDYWTRTSAGTRRVTAYDSRYIQSSGVLEVAGTFTEADVLTCSCQFIR